MERAASHDPELLLAHADWLRALAARLVREGGDDVEQETWLAALRAARGRRGDARGWLGAIARNAARQRARSEGRRAEAERGRAAERGLSDDALGERLHLQRWLLEHVDALPASQRRAIVLRYYEGLPPRRIARVTGEPVGTVKTRLKRALVELRERIERDDARDGDARGVLALAPLAFEGTRGAWIGAGGVAMGTKGLVGVLGAVALVVLAAVVGLRVWGTPEGGASELASSRAVRLEGAAEMTAGEEPVGAEASPGVAAEARELADGAAAFATTTLVAVERGSGAPVAGAEVRVVSFDSVRGVLRDRRRSSFDPEPYVATLASVLVADAAGRVVVPSTGEFSLAIARAGELYGELTFVGEPDESATIELAPDRSLTLRAVDVDGAPVEGVPVGLELATSREGSGAPQWFAVTEGPEATATLHHLDQVLDRTREPGMIWSATLATPTESVPRIELDPHALPTEDVALVVAEGGTVVVTMTAGQERTPARGWVHLTRAGQVRDELHRPIRYVRHGRWTDDGRAVFEHVGLGLDLVVAASTDGFAGTELVRAGPRSPGEEVRIDLHFDRRLPRVTGRLLGPDGTPHADAEMEVSVLYVDPERGNEQTAERFRADAEGRFECIIRRDVSPNAWTEVVLESNEAYATAGDPRFVASRPLALAEATDTVDLGDVQLATANVFLAGRVVDGAGEPIYWASLSVKRFAPPDAVGVPPYEWVREARTQTDEAGEFRMTGELGPGEYALLARANGFFPSEEVPFTPGTQGIEVVLDRAGALEGRVVLPDGVPHDLVGLLLAREGEEPDWTPWTLPRLSESGAFSIPDLAPGPVDVGVVVFGFGEPFSTVRDVLVVGGETVRDPRLDPLVLEGVHGIELTVVDDAGEPVPKGYALHRPLADHDADRCVFFGAGTARLVADRPAIDVDLTAPGFRPLRLEGARDGETITLQRGIPVHLRLDDRVELPPEPWRLEVELSKADRERRDDLFVVTADGTGRRLDRYGDHLLGDRAAFDGTTRDVVLGAASPGRWRIDFAIVSDRASVGVRDAAGTPYALEVGPDGVLTPVTIAPDAEALRRAPDRVQR